MRACPTGGTLPGRPGSLLDLGGCQEASRSSSPGLLGRQSSPISSCHGSLLFPHKTGRPLNARPGCGRGLPAYGGTTDSTDRREQTRTAVRRSVVPTGRLLSRHTDIRFPDTLRPLLSDTFHFTSLVVRTESFPSVHVEPARSFRSISHQRLLGADFHPQAPPPLPATPARNGSR